VPNGEVEGPRRSDRWRRGRTISQHRSRQATGASRRPPTIVRRLPPRIGSALPPIAQPNRNSQNRQRGDQRRHRILKPKEDPESAARTYCCRHTEAPSAKKAQQTEQNFNYFEHAKGRLLTVKLRGRTEAPDDGAEGAQFPSARGAKQEALHVPLQRSLDAMSHLSPTRLRRGEFPAEPRMARSSRRDRNPPRRRPALSRHRTSFSPPQPRRWS